MEKKKLVKRKKQGKKPKYMEQDPFAYILSDVKETVVTENYYQPIPELQGSKRNLRESIPYRRGTTNPHQ